MTWKTVCGVDDVDTDSIKKFTVDGVELVIARYGDEFTAMPPVCPHMEEQLDESGMCAGGLLTCSKHLWQWDLRTGEQRGPAEKPLLQYDVRCEDGQVLVSIDSELTYDFDSEDDDEFEW